jgi:excisionase family DNA binding protein
MMTNPDAADALGGAYLITVKEASRWLSMPVFTLYSWAQARKIPHHKLGKRVMFAVDDLKKWLAEHRRDVAG